MVEEPPWLPSLTPDLLSCSIDPSSISLLYFLLTAFPGMNIVEAVMLSSRTQGCTVCVIEFTSYAKAICACF